MLITLDNPYKYLTQIYFTTIMGFEILIHLPIVKKLHSIDLIEKQKLNTYCTHFSYKKHTLSNHKISGPAKTKL